MQKITVDARVDRLQSNLQTDYITLDFKKKDSGESVTKVVLNPECLMELLSSEETQAFYKRIQRESTEKMAADREERWARAEESAEGYGNNQATEVHLSYPEQGQSYILISFYNSKGRNFKGFAIEDGACFLQKLLESAEMAQFKERYRNESLASSNK